MIDESFADLEKAGYSFLDSVAPTNWYWAMEAHPLVNGVSGDRYFFVDISGVIRFETGGTADSSSAAID